MRPILIKIFMWIAAALMTASIAAVTTSDPGEACGRCGWGAVCVPVSGGTGICERTCDVDSDCPEKQRCLENLDLSSNLRIPRYCERRR